jgi:5-methylthioribose kinase
VNGGGPYGEFVPDASDPVGLVRYLREQGWLEPDDRIVEVGPAGDGNMNRTLRVVSERRRLIVKHGPPWVEKYPEIPAPPDRTLVEAAFYQAVPPGVAARMPVFHGVDRSARVLVLEDVEAATDLTAIYEGAGLEPDLVSQLLDYLAALHRAPLGDADRDVLANEAMRVLNHEYIFRLPLSAEAALLARLDQLTPGLSAMARALSGDAAFVARTTALGAQYLHGRSDALIHGDYFPGSWLSDGHTVRIIDPEFCFLGEPAFDYGVMAAHLVLAGDTTAVHAVAGAASAAGCDRTAIAGFAGVEIMRRLLGVAQLPRLVRTLAEKRSLLQVSRALVVGRVSLAVI